MTTTIKTSKTFAFEPALIELEEITAWFESSEADLDQGLARFERGMELAAQLKEHLAQVENKIEKIKQKFEPAGEAGAAGEVSAVADAIEDAEADEPTDGDDSEDDGRFDSVSDPEPGQTGLF
jgi:exodeoxyribonuclease VII small subunit